MNNYVKQKKMHFILLQSLESTRRMVGMMEEVNYFNLLFLLHIKVLTDIFFIYIIDFFFV